MLCALMAQVVGQGLAAYPIVYEKPSPDQAPNIYIVEGPSQGPRLLGPGTGPTVVQGGRYVAYVATPKEGGTTLVVADSKGEPKFTFTVQGASLSAPSFSPNGSFLAFVADTSDSRTVMGVKVAKGAEPLKLADAAPGSPDPSPAFTSDGSSLVFNLGGSWVDYRLQNGALSVIPTNKWIADLPKGLKIDRVLPDFATPGKMLFSVVPQTPDEKGLCAVFVHDPDQGGTFRVSQIGVKATKPRWAADGRTVLFQATDEKGLALFSVRSDGKNLTRLFNIDSNG